MTRFPTTADAALLVYDITDHQSFIRVQHWVKELRKMLGTNIVIAIAGNKCDLERSRNVDKEEALKYAKSVGATHFLTSAKTNRGLDSAFQDIVGRTCPPVSVGRWCRVALNPPGVCLCVSRSVCVLSRQGCCHGKRLRLHQPPAAAALGQLLGRLGAGEC